MSITVLMGPPGSGKGTLAQSCKKIGFEVIGVGDLLRIRSTASDDLGEKIKTILSAGQSVSNDLVRDIVFQELLRLKHKNGDRWPKNVSILLDGFPRNIVQMTDLYSFFSSNSWIRELNVFSLNVDKGVLLKRLGLRFSCGNCFSVQKTPGHCQNCGSNVFRRSDDDSMGAIEQRMAIFNESKTSIVNFVLEKEIKFFELNVFEKTSEQDVLNSFLEFLGKTDYFQTHHQN